MEQGTVVTSRMVFSVVVAQVCAAGMPVDEELFLLGLIMDPVKAHIGFLQVFLIDDVVCKPSSDTNGGGRLWMDKFYESGAYGYSFLSVDEGGDNFLFRGG